MRLDAGRASGRECQAGDHRMNDPQDPSLADAALAYAAAGIPVLPLEPGGKAPHPLLEGPPLCPGGVFHATTSADRIAYWWREAPDANIGVACGRGVAVLDLDAWSALG